MFPAVGFTPPVLLMFILLSGGEGVTSLSHIQPNEPEDWPNVPAGLLPLMK